MGCAISFSDLQLYVDFFVEESNQKILIEILLQHSSMSIEKLAGDIGVSEGKVKDVCNNKDFLSGYHVDNLSQIFLRFFGEKFFRKFSIVRNFINNRF
ncbi:hypothetical protein [Legionella sp. CNM-4043-24]|uniref:hypothetical protein n=1 Tax=Legionella sp. CNM-4043-24 TaxID=3421646 RepID=UPI00403B13EC